MDFTSIRNHHEHSVFKAIVQESSRYPDIAQRQELLLDAACVALNRLPPQYIRHQADFTFFLSEQDRLALEGAVSEAVAFALEFVRSRNSARPKP